jgi:hypothetical protein
MMETGKSILALLYFGFLAEVSLFLGTTKVNVLKRETFCWKIFRHSVTTQRDGHLTVFTQPLDLPVISVSSPE